MNNNIVDCIDAGKVGVVSLVQLVNREDDNLGAEAFLSSCDDLPAIPDSLRLYF